MSASECLALKPEHPIFSPHYFFVLFYRLLSKHVMKDTFTVIGGKPLRWTLTPHAPQPTKNSTRNSNKKEFVNGLNAVLPTTHPLVVDVLIQRLIQECPW